MTEKSYITLWYSKLVGTLLTLWSPKYKAQNNSEIEMGLYLTYGPKIYPNAHENPRAFSCILGLIFLESLSHGSGDGSPPWEDCIMESTLILPQNINLCATCFFHPIAFSCDLTNFFVRDRGSNMET